MFEKSDGLGNIRPSENLLPPLLYRFDAQLTVTPIGLVPEGLRMANSFEGRVTEGLMKGARVWGIDHLLLRADGVAVIDAQKTISKDEVHVYEHVHGYGLSPRGLHFPALEDLLDPAWTWPEVDFPIVGASTFRAADADLRYLNQVVCRIDGWFSFATGALGVETRILGHLDRVRTPRKPGSFDVAAPSGVQPGSLSAKSQAPLSLLQPPKSQLDPTTPVWG